MHQDLPFSIPRSPVPLSQHGTIEEIIKHLDTKKYPLPDDWLEPSERAEKRKQAKQEAKARKEARAKEEAKMKADTAKAEAEAAERGGEKKEAEDGAKAEIETLEEPRGVVEEGAASSAKRERETDDGLEDEEELDDTPPMYRQARALFLKPEARMAGVHVSKRPTSWHALFGVLIVFYAHSPCCLFDFTAALVRCKLIRRHNRFSVAQVEPAGEFKLKWTDPDEAGLIKFLVEDKGCVLQPGSEKWSAAATSVCSLRKPAV